MSIIDPKTGCTLHPDVQVGSQLTWRELSEGQTGSGAVEGTQGVIAFRDQAFEALVNTAEQPDHPQLVVRHGEVIEIVEDDFGDWLLVKFTGLDGVVYETDIPGEWWDGVDLVGARF